MGLSDMSVSLWAIGGTADRLLRRGDFSEWLLDSAEIRRVIEPVSPTEGLCIEFTYWNATTDEGTDREAVDNGLVRTAAWLSKHPSVAFDDVRRRGFTFQLVIGGFVSDSQYQLDVDIPLALISECARLTIPMHLVLNDYHR